MHCVQVYCCLLSVMKFFSFQSNAWSNPFLQKQKFLFIILQLVSDITQIIKIITIAQMLKQIWHPITKSKIGQSSHFMYLFGIVKFNLPDLGEKIKEGTIKKLYVNEGDKVTEFQKLADVASDKQFTEITALQSGIIHKIHHKEEDICQVGELFLEIEVEGGQSTSEPSKVTQKQQIKEKKPDPVPSRPSPVSDIAGQILATPFIRNLIKQKKLDITKIRGTGKDGRILESDIEAFTKSQSADPIKTHRDIKQDQGFVIKKMSNFEKGMQKSMTESNKIPHLYLHQQFDITETQKMRKTLKNSQTKVTLMGIMIKTFSLAINKYPIMNSTYEPEKSQFEYTINGAHNISIAIDSPNGLVVPHLKNVQNLSLLDIQAQLERLRNLASEAKLTGKQLQGGTICLSNIGTIGGINTCPLILPPQVCIVGIGKMQVVPRFSGEQVVPRTMISVSYGCDHRVVDGATVARFSNEWKRVLQNPYLALAEMH